MFSLTATSQNIDLEAALRQLDSVVANRGSYIQKRQQDIDHLKKALETSTTVDDKYGICKRIYDEYQKFDADSALVYAYRCQKLANMTKRKDDILQAKIDEMTILIYRGEYIAAKERLTECGPIENLPLQTQTEYAIAALEYYMRIENKNIDITDQLSSNGVLCWNKYRKYIPVDSWCYDYYEGMLTGYNIDNRYIQKLKSIPKPSIPAAMVECALAVSYKKQKNFKLYYYYLISSAINDIISGNRDVQSLVFLIKSPYIMKDTKRAFTYTMVCTENAKAYKDAGRSLDIIGAHAVITKAFETAMERKNTYMSIIIALLAIFVVVIFIQSRLIVCKRKRQNAMFIKLKEVNGSLNKSINKENEMRLELKENNDRLQEELKYRNGNFVDAYLLVSQYIADIEKFKKSVYNLIITGNADKAKRALNSSTNMDDYLQNFYKQFDKAYLSTHPDFIMQFNKLMKPDKQIIVSLPNTLTPELRIYALVSLGITDSVSIADFLHYSTQTIYNYRLKIRHNSSIPEKDFADAVAKMYYQ